MKLEEIARKSIEIIKAHEGIGTDELAKILQIPKRRVYDVKAIMKAANLITTSRDKYGTKIYWNHPAEDGYSNDINQIHSKRIKVKTSGIITNVSNKGTEVVIEGTAANMSIEPL